MEAWEVLIIILSVTLTVFLIAGIILLSYLIKIAHKINNITEKAETVAASLSEASRYVRPAVLAASIAKFFRKATAQKRRNRE